MNLLEILHFFIENMIFANNRGQKIFSTSSSNIC